MCAAVGVATRLDFAIARVRIASSLSRRSHLIPLNINFAFARPIKIIHRGPITAPTEAIQTSRPRRDKPVSRSQRNRSRALAVFHAPTETSREDFSRTQLARLENCVPINAPVDPRGSLSRFMQPPAASTSPPATGCRVIVRSLVSLDIGARTRRVTAQYEREDC